VNSFWKINFKIYSTILWLFIVSPLYIIVLSQVDSLKEKGYENLSRRIILIGDAGESHVEIDPVMLALKSEVSIVESTLVVFLGDNVYPAGLVGENSPDREEAMSYLNRQINTVLDANAKGLFIPGNHDWDNNNYEGWENIKRQAYYVNGYKEKNIIFLPENGCPGPEVIDFGNNIRVVILDTQWWLRDSGTRPEPGNSECSHCYERSVISALDSVLAISSDKFVILAAHHPLSTHGPHGGYFSWVDHIFPLTNLNEYLWIPLPVIGSLYPLIRGMGVSKQDLSSNKYTNMREQIEGIVIKYPNVLVASGHEHALQVLEGPAGNYYLVSGAGVWGDVEESLSEDDDTIFNGRYEGFMILDFYKAGKGKLSVIRVVDEFGHTKEVYSKWVN